MIRSEAFLEQAVERGFRFCTGVPCSYLRTFPQAARASGRIRYVSATNEGDAVAIAAGAWLGGARSFVFLQNSGLGNAVNPLSSLTHTARIPVLLLVTLRGDPQGSDEPQHELMGRVTQRMLELLEIPWSMLPAEEGELSGVLDKACREMEDTSRPVALVVRKGTFAPSSSVAAPPTVPAPAGASPETRGGSRATRREMLRAVRSAVESDDLLVCTTGYTGRELFALGDGPNQLYMVGSMGCASSLGLGLGLARTDRRVFVLDGDGAALMRLGSLAAIGHERPENLVHIVLDNGVHESTGGQPTVSPAVDFPRIAAACGYPRVFVTETPQTLAELVRDPGQGPVFVHAPIVPGVPDGLPRPDVGPAAVAARLRELLETR